MSQVLVIGQTMADAEATRQSIMSAVRESADTARRAALAEQATLAARQQTAPPAPAAPVAASVAPDEPAHGADADGFSEDVWRATRVLDRFGLYTTEIFQKSREEIIAWQQADMLELSTPVVKLWDGVLALPMIGTLDSHRTQVVMETLLQRIVETGAEIAIIDITGVPTVDTLTAQHLLKTVTAARLMGAIERTLAAGDVLTPDLGGNATTADVTARVCELLRGANL